MSEELRTIGLPPNANIHEIITYEQSEHFSSLVLATAAEKWSVWSMDLGEFDYLIILTINPVS